MRSACTLHAAVVVVEIPKTTQSDKGFPSGREKQQSMPAMAISISAEILKNTQPDSAETLQVLMPESVVSFKSRLPPCHLFCF